MLIHRREATPLPPVTYGLQGQKLSLINLINQSSRHEFFCPFGDWSIRTDMLWLVGSCV